MTTHVPILRWGAPWRTGTTAAPTAGRAPPSGSPEPCHKALCVVLTMKYIFPDPTLKLCVVLYDKL